MRDLNKSTLIIPIKIEHPDRYRNAKTTLGFLNSHLNTNIIIYEVSDDGITRLDFLKELINLNINHIIVKSEGSFHRTKYLNIMLDMVKTPVVINYDIDVLLDPANMEECQNLINSGKASVIYPYELGLGQIQVRESFDYGGFIESGHSMEFINNSPSLNLYSAECGHCIFFNTKIYRDLGGENENFISYGPEDKERLYRFQILTNSVIWRNGFRVYHFEHYRGEDSWTDNPSYYHNWDVFNKIKNLSSDELSAYYNNPEYCMEYTNIGKNNILINHKGPVTKQISDIIGINNTHAEIPKERKQRGIDHNDPTSLR